MARQRKATHIQIQGNSEGLELRLQLWDVENSRCLIFVTQSVQAVSKSLLKLCDKRNEQFYYLNSGYLNKNSDKIGTSSNHRSVRLLSVSALYEGLHVVCFQICNWSTDT